MFTVIIYYDKDTGEMQVCEKINLEKYDFLFSYARLKNQLIIKAYVGETEQVISELNQEIAEVSDWKLILFDGRLASGDMGEDTKYNAPDIIRREWNRLLLCLSDHKHSGIDVRLEGSKPREIWYLSCWNKGTFYAADENEFAHARLLLTAQEYELFFPVYNVGGQIPPGIPEPGGAEDDRLEAAETVLEENAVMPDVLDVMNIPSLRMCWTELEPGTGLLRQQEELQVGCILLILACNDIPASFLISGYLYRISIGIDRERLAQYVGRLRRQNLERVEQYRKELKRYDMEGQPVPYVKPENLHYRPMDPINWLWDKKKHGLVRSDLRSGNDLGLDDKLKDNQQWLYKLLYLFNDYLHGIVTKTVEIEKENRDVLLDASGEASVRSALESALHTIRAERRAEDNPLKVEKRLQAEEHKVRSKMETKLDVSELRIVRKILALIEGISFAVFGMGLVKGVWHDRGEWFPYRDLILYVLSSDFGRSVLNILVFLFCSMIIALLVWMALGAVSLYTNWRTRRKYNKYLNKIHTEQCKKRENVDKIMEEIIKYQYHWALCNEKFKVQVKREKEKECLLRHAMVRRNAADVCSQLERMLGEDERISVEWMLLPNIDFSKDPEQVDYYWVPFLDYGRECTLNNTGGRVDVFFDFIVNFGIHETPALRILNE